MATQRLGDLPRDLPGTFLRGSRPDSPAVLEPVPLLTGALAEAFFLFAALDIFLVLAELFASRQP